MHMYDELHVGGYTYTACFLTAKVLLFEYHEWKSRSKNKVVNGACVENKALTLQP